MDGAGIPWMIAGSVASSTWGEVRSTQDIDLVVVANRTALVRLCRALPAERWYADLDMAIDASRRQSMFNIIDLETGWKIGIILRKGRPFSEAEFARRRRVEVDGALVWVASPEDVILAKLEWANATGSERQVRDAAGIVTVQGGALDEAWLRRWAQALDARGAAPARLADPGLSHRHSNALPKTDSQRRRVEEDKCAAARPSEALKPGVSRRLGSGSSSWTPLR